ncbi:hypothetical protein HanRHA438_Chr02g0062451 [Helianthus annuus]|nr:hypothetical protein HanRHA438_Chr02g0062451 [Helianthus annuus]
MLHDHQFPPTPNHHWHWELDSDSLSQNQNLFLNQGIPRTDILTDWTYYLSETKKNHPNNPQT